MKKDKITFTSSNTTGGLHIPPAALTISGLYTDKPVEYRVMPSVVAAYKKQMTALELANAAYSLQTLANELFNALCDACGECDKCGVECPYSTADFEMDLELPDELMERAGLESGEKLFAAAVNGGILICPAKDMPSLQSVPGELMEMLLSCDVCPEKLEDHIVKGDIVYGVS